MAVRQAYKKKVTLAYVKDSEYIEIQSSKIVYIIIEHMYEQRVMPVIYLSFAAETDLYTKILENKDSAKMYLRVQRYDAYSNTALYKDDVNKQFTYILSNTTPEYSQDLADANSNVDSAYKVITMGLLDMNIMNTLRVSFGGIKKNVDTYNLIYSAVENTKIIMKTPKYNTTYESLFIPSLGSRKEMLNFLFNEDPFYDTQHLYFIDYDVSYLLDQSGDALSANDGTLDTVTFDIQAVTAAEAYYEGMEIKDNGYYMYINPANTNVTLNMGTEKVANQLVASYVDGSNTVDLNINTNEETTTKQVFNRFKSVANAIVYKNAVESAQVCIELVKEFIDSSIITPNKSFTINNFEGYSQYNGRYLLVYKKDVIQGTATDFASITTVGLKKLGNIQEVGLSNFAGSSTSSKTTKTTAMTSTYSTRTSTTTATNKSSSASSSR